MPANSRSVCIIGAGAGGLITAQTILNDGWADRRLPSLAEISDPDAMYHSLHTNLPKEVMQFRDFPFSPDLPSFIPRAAVQRYLEDFVDSNRLRGFIKFNAEAVSVERSGEFRLISC
ncbi:dimethylaniline monooxygenase, putative [Perkinsus marinus ATCC 50983]|uniref:Dimethylaniline monooxygenase, putative n=1 Tax=Perkinsus marinus (strain ATCC 50983 / TXsc) TaxID=423536 RepID=C5LB19_PERM5|nr:dimethylaniline monooxygenase, putative [Perkinsus marinus ATCC 50983]EER05947.1 dimethylaniline monooxygenase, putative [Perkinsus marinus ATCC 50983]|eukprot:XP_002774131.1 dimethylaniline monooxygenase, putative [Perkinsus marinus ATCC 50983]